MRLLHVKTNVIEVFHSSDVPGYAILSHTWGPDEVTFQDFSSSRREQAGWAKIRGACTATKEHGLDYIWIDTCCIDKTSSSELSEAINSMFQWYKGAESQHDIHGARWFTRGWTLQELIASKDIVFFSKNWKQLGAKHDVYMLKSIQKRTTIDETILLHPELLPTVSVARRISWASSRETTRPEDIAYCLMGLFGVNMPLLYGEGTNAFIRLQEEILKDSEDESIFSWNWKSQGGYAQNGQTTSQYRGIIGSLADHLCTSEGTSG
ncbi:uncharacterized protein K460DRAFT_382862 [Cucurbitaria berberidis CBS 394.84]|uniref:HET-domain-containing protein n=1 Tax=Cucurbitaria berberidis CBS 394.84 TaxID=1168544 RepID=A0A9P4LDX0_9PLEO|nr:uncharacterized protein K460DRAFT_382862 [Cucurbitaria berberidis CBS 394.84]KAF1851435.1 hypothetical protein K460DRAFT_382862 [Cucurbitaria berberidis CBS 394.84]